MFFNNGVKQLQTASGEIHLPKNSVPMAEIKIFYLNLTIQKK